MSQLLGDNKYAKSINSWQVSIPVTTCIPTLSVVSWKQSVLPVLLNSNILRSYFIASNPLSSAKPLHNDTVITTATGSFVAAGVNRWASMYVVNTSAFIETNDIPGYYYFNSAKQLQDLAGQYFYDYKEINDDLITMQEGTFKSLVKSTIGTDTIAIPIIMTSALNYSTQQVAETPFQIRLQVCADYLWQNLSTLQSYVKTGYPTWNTTTYTVNSAVSGDSLNIGTIAA